MPEPSNVANITNKYQSFLTYGVDITSQWVTVNSGPGPHAPARPTYFFLFIHTRIQPYVDYGGVLASRPTYCKPATPKHPKQRVTGKAAPLHSAVWAGSGGPLIVLFGIYWGIWLAVEHVPRPRILALAVP